MDEQQPVVTVHTDTPSPPRRTHLRAWMWLAITGLILGLATAVFGELLGTGPAN